MATHAGTTLPQELLQREVEQLKLRLHEVNFRLQCELKDWEIQHFKVQLKQLQEANKQLQCEYKTLQLRTFNLELEGLRNTNERLECELKDLREQCLTNLRNEVKELKLTILHLNQEKIGTLQKEFEKLQEKENTDVTSGLYTPTTVTTPSYLSQDQYSIGTLDDSDDTAPVTTV